ncbi:multisubunit potassium/proton antiporter PhaC subunit [Rhodovulum imhoffii]|uniref:Multisubunit potassium/proton antiporter PhaC subunit n=1 Tax=Rhodovulum imhoffii TaxID=365340 RepID=A0A2T5BVJ0_9RHOB|nr:Na+/H+ antiporter subunit C [Rhodovulum imhoffii]MBK5932838.1 Na+/H+ antiporter subunit C [Rhodovulum imhoffii]PTN03593.1 multisubunit potassium/proton antiporter PhaC subunit [Rhodovulum imhoffii]
MELLFASAVGILTAAGLYLVMRQRTFPVILGISLLSYAVNLFLFASGRLAVNMPPVLLKGVEDFTDPLPQALVLTAIVISFGMTAVVVMLSLGAYLSARSDRIDLNDTEKTGDTRQ